MFKLPEEDNLVLILWDGCLPADAVSCQTGEVPGGAGPPLCYEAYVVSAFETNGHIVLPAPGLLARIALAAQKSAPPSVKVVGTC